MELILEILVIDLFFCMMVASQRFIFNVDHIVEMMFSPLNSIVIAYNNLKTERALVCSIPHHTVLVAIVKAHVMLLIL